MIMGGPLQSFTESLLQLAKVRQVRIDPGDTHRVWRDDGWAARRYG